MSLLSETSTTVIDTTELTTGSALVSKFSNTNSAYSIKGRVKAVSGYAMPTANGSYLVRDNLTNEPIEIPLNALPLQGFIIPTVPLESADLSDSIVTIQLYDDVSFSNSFSPWVTGGDVNQNGRWSADFVNAKTFNELSEDYAYYSDWENYRFVGIETSGTVITAGTLQIYIVYHSYDM
jgi:hypothetical protein